jgi:hypothetical protein
VSGYGRSQQTVEHLLLKMVGEQSFDVCIRHPVRGMLDRHRWFELHRFLYRNHRLASAARAIVLGSEDFQRVWEDLSGLRSETLNNMAVVLMALAEGRPVTDVTDFCTWTLQWFGSASVYQKAQYHFELPHLVGQATLIRTDRST